MLALALALVLGSGGAASADPAGPPTIDLQVEVWPLEHGAARPPPMRWREEGDERIGVAADARYVATVRIAPAEGGAGSSIEVAIRYAAPVEVEREALSLRLHGGGRALFRDLSFAELQRPLRVDRGTPILLATGYEALVGGPGFVAARYTPVAGENAPATDVELVLDDTGSHPFAVYDACLDRLPMTEHGSAPFRFSALEHKRRVDRTPRQPFQTVTARATLYRIAGGDLLPVVIERWAGGARAAIVFTDHADRTDPPALRALLHGTSDRASPEYGRGGFFGHGVRITKSFFAHGWRGGLDDPEARELAQELLVAGSEVALHSVSGAADDRAAVASALPKLRDLRVATWIDHEPYTNCEAISSQGWRTDGRYGIRDLLALAGFHWVWEAGDLGGFGGPRVIDLFAAAAGGSADPPIYPLPFDDRIWVFQSTYFYGPPDRMAAALDDAALDAFERGRGLFVAHTYLSASARTTTSPEHLAWLAVRQDRRGALVLDPDLDGALARIGRRVRAETLASLTWAEAGERLRDLAEVEVSYLRDGSARIANRGSRPLEGLTLAIPAAALDVTVQGAKLDGVASDGDSTRFWLDLAPGASATVRASHGELPVPFLTVPEPPVVTR